MDSYLLGYNKNKALLMLDKMVISCFVRSSVMSDLRKRVQLLGSLEGAINAVQERSTSLHSSISQRLKWASGANPSLNAVLRKFDEAVTDRNKIYAVSKLHLFGRSHDPQKSCTTHFGKRQFNG